MPSAQAIALLLTLTTLTFSLHISNPALHHQEINEQLQALRNQQSAFEKEVVGLIDDIKNIELKVNATTVTNEKVLILQTAILSEREKIFKLQNSIIPPFNLSKNACQELTNEQKVKMLDQLQKAKDEVAKLKAIAAKLPSNTEVSSVNSDIAKQQTLLQGISKAIYSQCQTTIVFTPTIFQTNLFASNWILGRQSIDNIVEQYYQRSRLYHNVTNCPLDFPFYDGTQCSKCQQPTPIFNTQLSKCDKCPHDTKLNTDKHVCEQIPHFTDYKKLDNFILDGAVLPAAPTDGTSPCPPQKPYFDARCVACGLPSYWNVRQKKCKDCPTGQIFNPNTKTCTVPLGNTLSYLQGNSRWVTSAGNFSNVLRERGQLIKNNPSTYAICGKDLPHFDGVACISCPYEFSLADKKCVIAPPGTVFNPNLHEYVTPIVGKATNPTAPNLLSNSALPPASNPCDAKTPFFDGIACIQCPQPFPLFDVSTNKCVRCSGWQQYDGKTLKCIKRPIVMISSNFSNLLGSPKSSLATYKAEILDKVKNNNDNIIRPCAADQYSNYTHCFKCLPPTQRFNVQTKKCDTCNGTVDTNTLICDPLKTMLTNLDSTNTIVGPTSNLAAYLQAQKQVKGPILKCPPQSPYTVGGIKCIACADAAAPYFDLQSQRCVGCPDKLFFNSVSHRCEKEIFITNVAAIKRFIQTQNYTVPNIKSELQNLSKTRKTVLCNENTPIANEQGDKCFACEPTAYYNLKSKECVPGVYVSNIAELRATGRVIQSEGRTLQAIESQNNLITQPKIPCPQQKPYFDSTKCVACPNQLYYLKGNSCYQPRLVSNFPALEQSARFIETAGVTLQSQKDEIKNANLPVITCPPETPLSDGTKCLFCPADKFYNIKDKSCYQPPLASNIDALRKIGKVIEEGKSTLANLQTNISQIVKPKLCPETTPLFDGVVCIACPAGNYYVLANSTCYTPKLVTNVPFLLASKNYVQSGGVTIQQIQDSITNQKLPVNYCPNQRPLFNGNACIGCAVEQYYGLQKKICLKVTVVSNTDALTLQNNYVQDKNFTLQNIAIANKKVPQPKRVCPADVPLFNGTNCIACKQSLYDLEYSKCSNCGSDFFYDSKTHKCVKKPEYYPNLNNNQWIVSSNAGLTKVLQLAKTRSAIPGSAMCPEDKPHFNLPSKNCESCAKDAYWNYDTSSCMSCAVAEEVDQNTRKCSKTIVGVHQTSLFAAKLLFDGLPKAQFQEEYDSNKQKYPNIQDCPAKKPYFDGFGCIECPPSHPLFSLLTKLCSSCPPNSIYDEQNRYCYSGKQLKTSQPSVGKMYSSIF